MAQTLSSLPVVIAAGGEGSRVGGNKPNLMLDGSRLLEHALACTAQWSTEIAVALHVGAALVLPRNVTPLYDQVENAGPLSALSNALGYAKSRQAEHVLLIPCDMPFLPDNLLQRLAQEIGSSEVAMARSHGRIHPICSLWETGVIDKIEAYAATGRRSLIGFAEFMDKMVVDWDAADPDPFFNINNPQDLEQAAAYLR